MNNNNSARKKDDTLTSAQAKRLLESSIDLFYASPRLWMFAVRFSFGTAPTVQEFTVVKTIDGSVEEGIDIEPSVVSDLNQKGHPVLLEQTDPDQYKFLSVLKTARAAKEVIAEAQKRKRSAGGVMTYLGITDNDGNEFTAFMSNNPRFGMEELGAPVPFRVPGEHYDSDLGMTANAVRRTHAARTVARQVQTSVLNPHTALGQRRIMREYEGIAQTLAKKQTTGGRKKKP